MTTILHTSVAGDKSSFREHATWAWFDLHESELPADWNVVHVILKKGESHQFDYDGTIRHFWGRDDLLIWERDMVPRSAKQVIDLFACPEPSCAIDYPLTRCYILDVELASGIGSLTKYPGQTHLLVCVEHQVQMSMMRDIKDKGTPTQDAVWNPGDWTHCDVPPLGLTRLKRELMLKLPPNWPRTHWLDVDQMVGDTLAFNGFRTHIHLPMAKHQRRFKPHECVFVATMERKYPILPIQFILPEHRARILQAHRVAWTHTAFPKVVVQ